MILSVPMPIPELVIKQRRNALRSLKTEAERDEARSKRAKIVHEHAIKAAHTYAAEYAAAEKSEHAARLAAEKAGDFHVPGEPKVLLLVRIRGIVGVCPKVRSILNLFRLRQINNAVFLRVNKATMNALKLVEPYVTYGEPTVDTIRNLIYKRGHAKVNGQRIPIVDNEIIDENLQGYNILCMEDLVHEIYTVGENFKHANNFLWPFKLNSPALNDKRNNFVENGDNGFRGKYINDFVQKMI